MKRKKGFTLIELLAVIVILAIIALISIPLVLKYIQTSRDNARLRSAENYIDAVEKAVVNQNMNGKKFNPNVCNVKDEKLYCDGILLDVSIKGVKPDNSSVITFNNGKIDRVKLLYGDKIIVDNEKDILVYGEDIEILPAGVYDDDNSLLASWEELVNKYGLNIEVDYTASTYKKSGTMYTVLNNNSNLSSATKVIIKEGITKIGNQSFRKSKNLKNIVLPETITKIGSYVFSESKFLEKIKIPESVANIGNAAFFGCENLEEVNIPYGITELGIYTFSGCKKIKKIELPLTLKKIGTSAFEQCSSLEELIIPESVTTINARAFKSCEKLKSIEISAFVTSIGHDIVSGCTSLENITVDVENKTYNDNNGSDMIIETAANKLVAGSKNVTAIPSGIKVIGNYAFSGLNLKNITIPDSVTSIGEYAFAYNDITSIIIPNSVTTIERYAFQDNSMKSVVIPKSVISIGYNIFLNCDNLEKIIVDEENPMYDSRDNSNAIIKTATNELIVGCKNTIIPNSIKTFP